MVNVTIDEIKAGVEAWIVQARAEAVSNTCSRILYILWLNHPEIDFSFFGGEVVEEVKRYAAEAAEDVEASTPLDSTEVISLAVNAEVQPVEVAKAQPVEAAEVKPAKPTASLS